MNRRDFLGLVAAISACGLPVTTQASEPSVAAPSLPEKPKQPTPVATRGERPRAGWEEWVRACLRDAIAIDVSHGISLAGPAVYRITYVKREAGAAERCAFVSARKRAEAGLIRYCEVREESADDPLEFCIVRSPSPSRRFANPQALVIEWVIA